MIKEWSVVSLCLCDHLDRMSHIRTKRNLCHIYIAVAHCDLCKALLSNLFTGSCKLTNLTDIGSLGSLTAGIGIHLGIKYHHVYIITGSKYMIQAAKTDVISPSVSTEDPYRLLAEVILLLKRCLCIRTSGCCRLL